MRCFVFALLMLYLFLVVVVWVKVPFLFWGWLASSNSEKLDFSYLLYIFLSSLFLLTIFKKIILFKYIDILQYLDIAIAELLTRTPWRSKQLSCASFDFRLVDFSSAYLVPCLFLYPVWWPWVCLKYSEIKVGYFVIVWGSSGFQKLCTLRFILLNSFVSCVQLT